MNRRTIIFLIPGLIIAAAVAIFFFTNNPEEGPRQAINLNDPNVIAISEGTEGDIHSLEIGVGFVGSDSRAGISIFDNNQTDAGVVEHEVGIGSSIPMPTYFIIVLDIDYGASTVTLEVLPN